MPPSARSNTYITPPPWTRCTSPSRPRQDEASAGRPGHPSAEPRGREHTACRRRTRAGSAETNAGPPRHDGVVPRTDTAHREIAAPPGRVFAALVDPDALAAWLPPGGMSARFERFDARPGGSYRMVLTYADTSTGPGKTTADSDVVEARYVDIVPACASCRKSPSSPTIPTSRAR